VELRLSEDRPIGISIVDADTKIKAFLPVVEDMIDSGLMTIEAVTVLRYGRKATSG